MLKEALQYIVGLKENKTYQIDGKTYSDNKLVLIEDERYYRNCLDFGSLDAIVQMIKTELPEYRVLPVFIRIKDHKTVDVFTRVDDREKRLFPYVAVCDDADFREGWRNLDSAIIELRSRFIPSEGLEYLLNLLSRINIEEGVKSEDNGVSQTVSAKKGVSLMQNEAVKTRIALRPFRTFREVPQPESDFILRLDENGRVGLFEADGGIWKMEAKDNIKEYFLAELADEITDHAVVLLT